MPDRRWLGVSAPLEPGWVYDQSVLTFTDFLEEIARNNQTITISPDEVNRLVRRFGHRVRHMGQWNTSDGSLEIPISAVVEAIEQIGIPTLTDALGELRSSPDDFVHVLESSSAAVLIDKIGELSERRFRNLMTRLQHSADPAEIEGLKKDMDEAIFGR